MIKKAQKPWLYFSDSVDPALKNKVLGITAPNCTRFESATLGFDNTDSDFRSKIKFVAWQDEENHSWTVDKITTHETATGSIPAPKETVMRGACFFDALYYMAYFEKTEKALGSHVISMPEKALHFRAAGEKAGQPFDAKNMPHPAVKGNILTDGQFDQQAYDVAARTEETTPASVSSAQRAHTNSLKERFLSALPQSANEADVLDAIIAQEDAGLMHAREKETKIAAMQKIKKSGAKVLAGLKKDHKLMGNVNPLPLKIVACVMTGGLYGLVLASEIHFNLQRVKKIKSAGRAAKTLPEGPLKSLLEEFNKNACFTMYAERAAYQVQECINNNKPAKARRKSFKNIEKAAKELDLAPAEVQKLKADFLQQVYKPGDFYDLLKKQWDEGEIQPEIKKSIKALEQGMTP